MPELTLVRNVCPHDCPDTCGMVVGVRDGKAVSVRGDAKHPFTRGFLCQKVANYLDRVYHPERVLYPMRRVGPKGTGQFTRISWDDAIAEIAQRFSGIIAKFGPQAILPYSYAGTLGRVQSASLDRRFFHTLGASLLDRTICATAGAAGSDVTLGTRAVVDPEAVKHAKYIINWGSNTSVTNSHQWAIMHQARKTGAKIVTIDPYRSPTAAKSDQWIAIRPGTDAALALGMMHVIFRDSLEDRDYLEKYTNGAAELRERALNDYPLDRVEKITHIPASVIETFAHEYATRPPALIRLNYGLQRHGGGGMAVRTVTCLPAIIGAWRHPGGGALLSTSKIVPWNGAALERPDLIPRGTRTINMVQLAEALAGSLVGPPVKALFVYGANPAASNPDQQRVKAGLARDDLFTVVHEQFQTDTADYADLLLPCTTQLEHLDLHSAYGHLYIQLNPPAIAPVGECIPNTELFRKLARAMNLDESLFTPTDAELCELALGNSTGRFDGITFARLQEGGPLRLNLPENFTPFAEGNFGTPSGKCELATADYLPPHESPETQPALAVKYPLQMICPPEPAFLNSMFVNIDVLRKTAGEPTVQIHPDDATPRGIVDGQMVRLENDRGNYLARAIVGDSVTPGTVVALGIWWSRYLPEGANINSLTSTAITDIGGGATFFDNLVEVSIA